MNPSPRPLTAKEKKAIKALHKVAEIWPDTLWLFSAGGSLCIMRIVDGDHVMEQQYIIDEVNIENDGGDW